MDRVVSVLKLGKMSYSSALKVQNQMASCLKGGNEIFVGFLILVEHNPVYTIGIRTKGYTVSDEEKLKLLGAEFHRTNRGGLITFHGPGQMVAYPILNLKFFKPSMHWYISNLENTIIDLCGNYKLKGYKSPYTGVWVKDKKICAIGVHGSRFITTHGLALNCNTDLSWYSHIVPCGIEDKGVTSLSNELGRDVSIEEVEPRFLECFSKTFSCNFVHQLPSDYISEAVCTKSQS